jgi:FtsP/CotA-like multicopper oxidase with cupredoxin domain
MCNANPRDMLNVQLSGCELRVVARDGVRLASPAAVGNVLLASANRADVAVRCATPGSFPLISASSGDLGQRVGIVFTGTLATVRVIAGAGIIPLLSQSLSPDLLQLPTLPYYLSDLRATGGATTHSVNMQLGRGGGGASSINGVTFGGPTDYQYDMALGSVQASS